MTTQRLIWILWPSFIVGGIAEVLFFTAFDPLEIGACLGADSVNRTAVYTVGFFLLWLLTLSSSLLTLYFQRAVHSPVARPYPDDDLE